MVQGDEHRGTLESGRASATGRPLRLLKLNHSNGAVVVAVCIFYTPEKLGRTSFPVNDEDKVTLYRARLARIKNSCADFHLQYITVLTG